MAAPSVAGARHRRFRPQRKPGEPARVLRSRLPLGHRRDARGAGTRREDRNIRRRPGDESAQRESGEGEPGDLMTDFNLPELGENIKAGDVLRVLVKPGDMIAKDQAVLELETDKATIEVPSSVAGQVKDVRVKAGDKVKVGQTILSVDDGAGGTADKAPAADAPVAAKAEDAPPAKDVAAEKSEPEREASSDAEAPGAKAVGERPAKAPRAAETSKVVDISRGARGAAEPAAESEFPPAPAAPSVRRTARELGVDINEVAGTSDGGRISVEDVKAHVRRIVSSGGGAGRGAVSVALPDFSRWGETDRQPMRAVR